MIMQEHVKTTDLVKIAQKYEQKFPLEIFSNVFKIMGNNEDLMEGHYLYFDKIRKDWIRSGKVRNAPFKKRMKDHDTSAKLMIVDSKSNFFY